MADSLLEKENIPADTAPSKRVRAPIVEGEDRVLEDGPKISQREDNPTVRTIAEKEQAHKHKVEDSKIKISVGLLIACFLMIIVFAWKDAISDPPIESTLFSGAFEFAKTIATALVGYLFAANTKDK